VPPLSRRRPAIRPIEASKVAVSYVRNTSTPAVGSAQIAVMSGRRRTGQVAAKAILVRSASQRRDERGHGLAPQRDTALTSRSSVFRRPRLAGDAIDPKTSTLVVRGSGCRSDLLRCDRRCPACPSGGAQPDADEPGRNQST